MSTYTHRTIIVPAAFQQLAQALCEAAAEGAAGWVYSAARDDCGTVWRY